MTSARSFKRIMKHCIIVEYVKLKVQECEQKNEKDMRLVFTMKFFLWSPSCGYFYSFNDNFYVY